MRKKTLMSKFEEADNANVAQPLGEGRLPEHRSNDFENNQNSIQFGHQPKTYGLDLCRDNEKGTKLEGIYVHVIVHATGYLDSQQHNDEMLVLPMTRREVIAATVSRLIKSTFCVTTSHCFL